MALIKCPECNKDISSQAITCPHCGHPLIAAQDKAIPTTSVVPLQPPPILPQGQMPPPKVFSPVGLKKKMSKAKLGCLIFLGLIAVFISLVLIGGAMLGTDQDNIPKTVKISPDDICFRQWKDMEDFHAKWSQYVDKLMDAFREQEEKFMLAGEYETGLPEGGRKLLQLSDAEATDIGNKSQDEVKALKAQFAADGRLWNVPVGTEIKITKYYDEKENEITPVWNEPQKAVSTPDGNQVYVAAEWEGRVVFTELFQPPQ